MSLCNFGPDGFDRALLFLFEVHDGTDDAWLWDLMKLHRKIYMLLRVQYERSTTQKARESIDSRAIRSGLRYRTIDMYMYINSTGAKMSRKKFSIYKINNYRLTAIDVGTTTIETNKNNKHNWELKRKTKSLCSWKVLENGGIYKMVVMRKK